MPVAKVFVDTNVLLYVHDRRNTGKAAQAAAWLRSLTIQKIACINLQVLNELAYVLLRKKWFDTTAIAYAVVDEFSALGDTSLTPVEVVRARGFTKRQVIPGGTACSLRPRSNLAAAISFPKTFRTDNSSRA